MDVPERMVCAHLTSGIPDISLDGQSLVDAILGFRIPVP